MGPAPMQSAAANRTLDRLPPRESRMSRPKPLTVSLLLALGIAFVCVLVLLALPVVWWVVFVAGPMSMTEGHHEYVAGAAGQIEAVADFDRLFPGSKRFLSYRPGTRPQVNCVAFFGGRYQLDMVVPVEITSATEGRATGPPRFFLYEVESFTLFPDGRASGLSYADQLPVPADAWERFVESGGDVAELGLDPDAEPLPDFEKLGKGPGNGP